MAFDSGFLRASLREIRSVCTGARVEKIFQPRADEIDLVMRSKNGQYRIMMRCGTGDSRVSATSLAADNPPVPPAFCMLLRKHLQGSILSGVVQEGFERVSRFVFAARDELGYDCEKQLICEICGRNSNLIFAGGEGRILGALRTVDFTTSRLRQVLPGMTYELPPAQEGRKDPTEETLQGFEEGIASAPPDKTAAAYINGAYFGVCPALAREIVYRATGSVGTTCAEGRGLIGSAFLSVMEIAKSGEGEPSVAYADGRPVEYSFIPLTQYGPASSKACSTPGEALDIFYAERDRAAFVSQRAADLKRTVSAAITRITKKLDIQSRELAECELSEELKRDAELITANLWKLKKGDREAVLTDYSSPLPDGGFAERRIALDPRFSPSDAARNMWKKYNKLKHRKVELAKQTESAKTELEYLSSVREALSRAETSGDLSDIRDELDAGGYLPKKSTLPRRARSKNPPAEYLTDGGFTVLCGRNNLQNDELTFRTAFPDDVWFHAKGVPGSHVILRTGGAEVPDADLTQAAQIAAHNSDARGGTKVPVDYTEVRFVKKPGGARPGFVTYRSQRTAYVTPDAEAIARMKK